VVVCGLTNGYLPTLIFQAFGCERYFYGAQLLITMFGVLACNRPNILTKRGGGEVFGVFSDCVEKPDIIHFAGSGRACP
jgi:hypothetical protein